MRSTSRLSSVNAADASFRSSSRSDVSDSNIPLHTRNLHNSVDILERAVVTSQGAEADSTAVTTDAAATLIDRMRDASEATIDINTRLRSIVQTLLGYQIDDELGRFSDERRQSMLAMLDKELSAALRESDQQVRNLTEGIMAMAQSHTNKAASAASAVANVRSSPTVRAPSSPKNVRAGVRSSIAVQSPQRDRLIADQRGGTVNNHRRSSLDLRRARTLLSTFEKPG